MSQTKKASFVEAIINTAIGFGVAYSAWPLAAQAFALPYSSGQHVGIVLFFTIISVARGYFVRRFFDSGIRNISQKITGEDVEKQNNDEKDKVVLAVLAEIERATDKFPTWPSDPLHALAVLGEEFGELNKEVLQLTYEPEKSSIFRVQAEAVQTAAMALRFIYSLDTYVYEPASQHSQGAS